ncbi:MAG: four helix bundle protein [Planctomycetaceae bacterium]|nr:four helix bundle protein [Planctomycetaceae bacterium]
MTTFDHEKLDVYQISLEFVITAGEIIGKLPTGRHNLADQLERAATSVVLNIAEGAGEFSRAEKARFYRMAKRSATECAAALDICRVRKLIDERVLEVGREKLLRVIAMLIRMVHGLESGSGRSTKPEAISPPQQPR